MKSNEWRGPLRLLAVVACVGFRQHVSAQSALESRLQQACVVLQQSPLRVGGLQVLAEAARATEIDPELRGWAMEASSVSLLMQGDTNMFERAVQMRRQTFPDRPLLIKIGLEDYTEPCKTCGGMGEKAVACPSCMGTGTCKACGGTGKRVTADSTSARCPACTRPGVCGMCSGNKTLDRPCPACKGAKRVFALGGAVRESYNAALAAIVARCQENVAFVELSRQAERESNADVRIGLFQSLTNRFERRTDLAPACALLDAALAKRESRLKALAEQEERERAEREVEALRTLARTGETDQAVLALRAYLEGHPETFALHELQELLEGLTAKQRRRRLTRQVLTAVGAAGGALLAILCLQPLLRRKPEATLGPLPGLDKIDKREFTDPLSLTAADSRGRVKNKTARIPQPGEGGEG